MALPTLTLKGQDFTIDNFATNNFATNNIGANNYLTYKWKADRNKITNKFASPPPYISPLQADINRKKEYWFDYDNPNQVNSIADVTMKTAVGLKDSIAGVQTWGDTLKQFTSDTWALLYKGTIQPLLNADVWALLNNQLVNFSETVDIVDGIWKGFAINSGMLDFQGKKFNLADGWEGVRQVIVDRKNFDFDTGNRLGDFVLELLTPTNIAIAAMSLGVGSAGKAALKTTATSLGDDAVEAITKRTAESFFKNYTGDINKAFAKMGKNLTKAEIDALTLVSKHATNLKVISSVNKFKKAVDVVDKVGLTIAIKSTVGIPWKIIKATSQASASTIRYFQHGLDRIIAGNASDSLVSTIGSAPDIEQFIKTFNDAAKLANEPEILVGLSDVISDAATKDNKKLLKLYDDFVKAFDSSALVKQYIEATYNTTGVYTPWEAAQSIVRTNSLNTFIKSLDDFANAASNGLYKTFDEYMNLVTIIYEAGEPSKGVSGLYETISKLQSKMQTHFVIELQNEVEKVLLEIIESNKSITNIREHFANINQQNLKALRHNEENIKKYLSPDYLKQITELEAKALSKIKEAKELIAKYGDLDKLKQLTKSDLSPGYLLEIKKKIKSLENLRTKEYTKYQKLRKEGKSIAPYDASVIDKQIRQLQNILAPSEDAVVKLQAEKLNIANTLKQAAQLELNRANAMKATIANAATFEDVIKNKIQAATKSMNNIPFGNTQLATELIKIDATDALSKLQVFKDSLTKLSESPALTVFKKNTIERYQTFIDEAIEMLQDGISKSNAAFKNQSISLIDEFGKDYLDAMETIIKNFNAIPDDIFLGTNISASVDQLAKTIYGDNILNFAKDMVEQVENKLKDTVSEVFDKQVKQTFYDAGNIKHTEFQDFIDTFDTLLRNFDDEMFEGLGILQGPAGTLEDITFEMIDAIEGLKTSLVELHSTYRTLGKIDATLLSSMFDELSNVKYSIDTAIKNLELKKALDAGLHGKFKQALSTIETIQSTLGLTADVEVAWTREVMNTYSLKLNAALRNLYILQTSDLDKILTAIAIGDYTSIPALETLEYVIQHYDINNLYMLKQALSSTDIVQIKQAYWDIMKEVYDPTKMSQDALLKAVETIIEVKEAAETIMDTLHGMVSVRKFYAEIQQAITNGLDKNVASSFLDAIQRLYDKPASLVNLADMHTQPDLFKLEINKVLANIEMQLRGATLPYSVKAESWRKRIIELVNDGFLPAEAATEYMDMFGDGIMAHTAVADSYSEYLIHKYILKDHLSQGNKYVYIDIEANGLNLVGSTIYQKSVVIPEHGIFKWYINTGVADAEFPVEDNLYYLLFGIEDRVNSGIPLDELKDKFKKIYQDGDMEVLKQHFNLSDPRIEIIPVKGEAELLKQSMEFIQSQKPPNGKLVYRLHNGLEYDVPLLNSRALKLGVDGYHINKANVEDTKVMLENMLGLRRLSIDEKATLENLITNHIITRNSELSSRAMKRSGVTNIDLSRNLGKFLPTIDREFVAAYEKLINIFDPVTGKSAYMHTAEAFTEAQELFTELTNAMQNVYGSLRDLKQLDDRLKKFKLIVDDTSTQSGIRILPDNWFKDIPEVVRANHVGVDMMSFNSVNGVYVPAIAPKVVAKPNVVSEFFDMQGKLTTPYLMERMTNMADNIQKTMLYIRDVDTINAMNLHDIQQLFIELKTELQRIAGPSYFSPILNDLKVGDTQLRAFATTYELYKIYDRIASGAFKLENFGTPDAPIWRYAFIGNLEKNGYKDILEPMLNSDSLFKRLLNEYGDNAKLFTLNLPDGEQGKVFEYLGRYAKASIDSLRALEEVQDSLKYTSILRIVPVYQGMADSFEGFQRVAQQVEEYMLYLQDIGEIKRVPSNIQDIVFAKLRPVVESYDAIIAYNKLEQVLGYTSDEMASYLRHHAKGLVIFNNSNIYSAKYFPIRGKASVGDILNRNMESAYIKLLQNKALYEAKGIDFKVTPTHTIIYIKEANIDMFKNVLYKPIVNDFDMEEWIDLIVDNALKDSEEITQYIKDSSLKDIKEALRDLNKSRQHLVRLANDASTSTLEVLDDIAMSNLVLDLQRQIPDVLSVDSMKHLGMFEGSYFNHSVLGHIDGRRQFMRYSSFNPAKNIFNAAQLMENKLGVQTLYTQLMQVPEFMVDNLLSHGKMSPQDMVDYLKKAPHLKVAFLNDKSKGAIKDFRLSAITINGVKDIEFARSVGAVIVDKQTYNTAYEVINNHKVKNSVMRFLDRVLVASFKISWLAWNYGVLGRNIVDTAMKNIATTKDLGIIPLMGKMTKDYYSYKSLLNEIYKYAQQQRIHIDVAVNEYFAKHTPNIARETFDMIWEYQRAGGEVGLVKEALNYYGDITDKLYKRVGYDASGLTEEEFKELLKMPDDTAEQFLKNKFPDNIPHIRNMLDIKHDRLTYKRAYKMHELYKGRDMSVEDFVNYLKTGKLQPVPGLAEEVSRLMEKTKNIRATDDMLTRVLQHPLISNSLSWNMQAEEILRLSLFRYLKEQGYSTAEAMAEIARTHFDYGHKNMAQVYLEMAMPFSTFRFMNIAYWAEELLNNHNSVEIMTKGWEAISQHHDRDIEDIIIRRSLQYQIFTGNLVLNEDTGFTAKLNPSAVDMMNFFAAPHDYVMKSFHSAGQAVWKLLTMQPYDGESEEDFQYRKQRLALELIPFVGSHINRARDAQRDGKSIALSLLLGPLFNTTWTPAQGKAYATWGPNKFLPFVSKFGWKTYPKYRRRYRPRKMYPSKWWWYTAKKNNKAYRMKLSKVRFGYKDWSGYSTFNRTYYGAYFKFKRGSVYPTKNYRSLNTAFSDIWRASMTKKGNPKYKFLAFPTNKWTLRLKVGILRNITNYYRWQ